MDLKEKYDVVVIGAGVGGLTAAAMLGKAGFSVCVLEKEPHEGGYLAGYSKKKFRFDTAIHWLNQCAPGGWVHRTFQALGTDHPQPVSQTNIRRYNGESYDYLLTNNPDQFRDQLIAEFPHEKKGLIRFFKAAKKIGHSFHIANQVFRTGESMNLWEKIKSLKTNIQFVLPFIPYISYSGEEGIKKGLNKFFKDERIHKIFAGDTEVLSCLVPIGWAYYNDYQSPPIGGGQVITEWLKYVTQYYKNPVFFNCPVSKLNLEGNKCTSVSFKRGHTDYTVKCDHVIATCDVETLYEKMLPPDAVPAKLKQKINVAELYSSSVTVSVALDCPAEDIGFSDELTHICSEKVARMDHIGGDPHLTEISVLAPSVRDKSVAPEGKGIITFYMPAYMNYKNEWATTKDEHGNYVRNEAYEKLKTEIGEVLIDRVTKRLSPDLRKHILFYDVASPITHWRYTGNKNGTIMGAKPGKENMMGKVAHYQTPVSNVLLGGHWAELGGGVPIAVKAGANAALLVMRKERKNAFRVLADYMDGKINLQQFNASGAFKPYDNSWKPEPTEAQRAELRRSEKERL